MDSSSDTRLGELLGRYQRLRAADPTASVAALRTEAGPLYEELRDLVDCLDLFIEDRPPASSVPAPAAASSGDPSLRPPRGRRWMLLGAALAVLASMAFWFTRTDNDAVALRVRVFPPAEVTLNGTPIPTTVEPGAHRLAAVRAGFRRLEQDLVVTAGTPVDLVLHLEPEKPFDPDTTAAVGQAYGISFSAPAGSLPQPIRDNASTDGSAVLRAASQAAEAVRLESARLPDGVRDSDVGRYLIAEGLYRQGHYRPAFELARALADAHPERREPLCLALHALWGLDLVASEVYAELFARYRGAD